MKRTIATILLSIFLSIFATIGCGGDTTGPDPLAGKGDIADWFGPRPIVHPACRVQVIGHMWFHGCGNAIDCLRGTDGWIYSGLGHDMDIAQMLQAKGYTVERRHPSSAAELQLGDLYVFSQLADEGQALFSGSGTGEKELWNVYLNIKTVRIGRPLNRDHMTPDNQLGRQNGEELARASAWGKDARFAEGGRLASTNAIAEAVPSLPDCQRGQ